MERIPINKQLYVDIIDFMNQKGYSYNTLGAYRLALKRLLKGNSYLDRNLVMKYLKGCSHPNQRAVIGIINSYCNYKDIDFNIIVPTIKQKPRKIPEILSIEDIRASIESCPAPYDLMMRCIYGVGAGLRISEAIKFCWDNIRWSEWINGSEYGVCVIKEAKRDKERVLNIPNEIMKDLFAYAKKKNKLNEYGVPSGGLIFPIDVSAYKPELYASNKKRWKHQYVKYAYDWFRHNIIKNCCEKAINKKIHSHMLRSSRATYLLEVEGVPIERIKELLGHADIQTTMIYARVDPKTTFNMMKNTKVI